MQGLLLGSELSSLIRQGEINISIRAYPIMYSIVFSGLCFPNLCIVIHDFNIFYCVILIP